MSKIQAVDDAYVDLDVTFDSFNLDPRLSEAIKSLGFKNPTLIQSKSIEFALQDKSDIVAKATTGSGKTGAYMIPIMQQILQDNKKYDECRCVVLVPTKELCKQVVDFTKSLSKNCDIRALNVSDNHKDSALQALLATKPDIVVSTPNKFVNILKSGMIDLNKLKESLGFITVDEADLILSYGYKDDLNEIIEMLNLSKLNVQSFIMSATLTEDIANELKGKLCKNAKVLRLNDDNVVKNKDKLIQYYIKTSEFDKFLISFVIFKLNLIKGKILVFVNNIERGYRLKLFLEQFGIRSCLLNSELPLNSRMHIIDQYNKNYYNLLIATDESAMVEHEPSQATEQSSENKTGEEAEQEAASATDAELSEKAKTKQNTKQNSKNKSKSDKEFGVSRGVDFRNVACVLNFDLPTTSKNYVHRIGRTARANKSGIALSFVVNSNDWGKHKQSSLLSAKKDEKIFERIVNKQQKIGLDIVPYKFNQEHLNSFRYRVEDAFRAVTNVAIREARIKELKQEILTSDKLKRHFEENPQDLEALRHDKELHMTRNQAHLKNLPNYLLPENMRKNEKTSGFIPFNKVNKKGGNKKGKHYKKKGGKGGKKNVLKTLKF